MNLDEVFRIKTKRLERKHTFPTALAPKRTVNDGSPSRARSITRNSVSRGKNPGRRVTACLMRTRGTSRSSVISLRASSSRRLDSVSERAVSEGWTSHGRTSQASCKQTTRHKHTFKRTPSTSLMPKKFRRLRSTLSAAELLR